MKSWLNLLFVCAGRMTFSSSCLGDSHYFLWLSSGCMEFLSHIHFSPRVLLRITQGPHLLNLLFYVQSMFAEIKQWSHPPMSSWFGVSLPHSYCQEIVAAVLKVCSVSQVWQCMLGATQVPKVPVQPLDTLTWEMRWHWSFHYPAAAAVFALVSSSTCPSDSCCRSNSVLFSVLTSPGELRVLIFAVISCRRTEESRASCAVLNSISSIMRY